MPSRPRSVRVARVAAGLGTSLAFAAAAGIAWSALRVPHRVPLPPALPGVRTERAGRAGRLSLYADETREGAGAPLLLLHSINAAASAYEVRPLFEALRGERPVFAPDLPGFGFCERAARPYTISLYVAAVHDALDAIEAAGHAGPVDVIALSLAGEFAARAALERPERFRSLALVTPTGFEFAAGLRTRDEPGSTREIPGLERILSVPLWSRAVFDGITSRASIRMFLKNLWGSPRIDAGLLEYDWLTAHQPHAQYAPFAFLCGRLFSGDIRNVYEQLELPVWATQCTRGSFANDRALEWAADWPNWRGELFDTGALPHFEAPAAFAAAWRDFASTVPARAPAPASREARSQH
jgi:pimeloyl-ACP methyl ester carboxylesterase